MEFEIQIDVAELIDFNGKHVNLMVIALFLINCLIVYDCYIPILIIFCLKSE